jgi:hypothetical protein
VSVNNVLKFLVQTYTPKQIAQNSPDNNKNMEIDQLLED